MAAVAVVRGAASLEIAADGGGGNEFMNALTHYDEYASPVGMLTLVGGERGLSGLFPAGHAPAIGADWRRDAVPFREVFRQLDEYFAGKRRDFHIPLDMRGTPFQLKVWEALLSIPFGETVTYGEQARRIGQPNASRAVGLANGRNPVSIIVPCHRVIGKNGTLTGYGGGLEMKRFLLDLENPQRLALV
jgi:methylated-DNA-[protein]-cysteine S-methyltransferase